MKLNKILFLFLLAQTSLHICAQSVDKNGQINSTNTNYVDKNGEIEGTFGVNKNGMAIQIRSNDLITSGLVMHLDAGNAASYSGTSTAWNDISGNGNNGTLMNEPTFDSGNNGSILFDGVNDYVNCGNPSISAGKITVNAWIKIETGSSIQHIVDSASNSWHLAILNNNRPYFFNGSTYHSGAPILDGGTWYMITGVQGTTLDIYINGVLGQSIATNANVTTNNINLGRHQSSSRPLNGNIAQVSIYNRALTAAEIQQTYNATKSRFE
jgi:hypothetical protein